LHKNISQNNTSIEDCTVPYDPSEHAWKMGRLMAKMPQESLTESVIFTPRHMRNQEDEKVDIKTLREELKKSKERESYILEAYDELMEHYEELRKYVKIINPDFSESESV
tara:strand:+ start:7344 stop:7673 length:330 start_codon:yes stop_codon:yes gene_type:complete